MYLINFTAVWVQGDWGMICSPSQICVLRGSTVEISCNYSYPSTLNYKNLNVQDRFWFTKSDNNIYVNLKTDPDVLNRVKYDCNDKTQVCLLTITDVRESDSAEYWFRFTTDQMSGRYTGSPGVTLTVTGKVLFDNSSFYLQHSLSSFKFCFLNVKIKNIFFCL